MVERSDRFERETLDKGGVARRHRHRSGRLRGFAYAGSEGNRRAIVAALEFSPTQLRIAHLAAVAPSEQAKPARGFWRWRKQSEKRPEVAYISEGRILVEPWEEAKSGGPMVLRR